MSNDPNDSTTLSANAVPHRVTGGIAASPTPPSPHPPLSTALNTETMHSDMTIEEEEAQTSVSISKGRTLAIITVCIPVIATDLGIPAAMQLWPTAAFALACGCTLLPSGAAADVLGCRRACLFGGLLQTASAVGAGFAVTATQLIALRVVAGLAASFCLPGAVGVAASVFPANISPRRRSVAFAAMGGGQAVGFGLGLTLGGVFSDTIGWRWGFYATAFMNGAVMALALWALPSRIDGGRLTRATVSRITRDMDWVGAGIISTSLALLSYELAVATNSDAERSMREPLNIVLLCTALALIPIFGLWMRRQAGLGRPALIPNTLWTNVPFTAVCITVFLVWGSLNASEQLTALYLQDVRGTSVLTASLYFMPAPVCGLLMNVAIGALLPRLRPSVAVPTACLVSGIAPLLLAALCRTDRPGYWRGIFQAMALNPLGADLIYTIANLVMTAAFPPKMQALAGGVFNMLAQIGKSVGIAISAVIVREITAQIDNGGDEEALTSGYRAAWWFNCSLGFASVAVSFWGLRSVQKLEMKRD